MGLVSKGAILVALPMKGRNFVCIHRKEESFASACWSASFRRMWPKYDSVKSSGETASVRSEPCVTDAPRSRVY